MGMKRYQIHYLESEQGPIRVVTLYAIGVKEAVIQFKEWEEQGLICFDILYAVKEDVPRETMLLLSY